MERPSNYKTVFFRGTPSVVVLSQSFNLIFGYCRRQLPSPDFHRPSTDNLLKLNSTQFH